MHVALFWGKDIWKTYKSARKGHYNDKHHEHMVKHYSEVPWYWYIAVLVLSFVLGIIVVAKENVSMPIWAYIVSLLLGSAIAPVVSSRRDSLTHRAQSSTRDLATVSRPTTSPR